MSSALALNSGNLKTVMKMNPNSEEYARNNSFQSGVYSYLIDFVVPKMGFHNHAAENGAPFATKNGLSNITFNDANNGEKSGNVILNNSDDYYNVLDIGSGDGYSTNRLYRCILDKDKIPLDKLTVIGLDVLPTMTDYANSLYGSNIKKSKDDIQHYGLKFVNADLTWDLKLIQNAIWGDINHPTKKFDQIVSSCCFHWINDQTKAMLNLRQLLSDKPNSSMDLVFGDRIVGSLDYAVQQIIQDAKWSHVNEKLKLFHEGYLLPWRRRWMLKPNPVAYYEQMMTDCGFEAKGTVICQLREIEDQKFASVNGIEDFVRGCFPDVLGTQEENVKNAFFKDFASHVIQYNSTHGKREPLIMSIPLMHLHYSSTSSM